MSKKKKPFDQQKYVTRLREESELDKSIPLGSPNPPEPEIGPTYREYYGEKLRQTGSFGEYELLNPLRHEDGT